ncbi:alpha/beta hydrolase [Tuanshanicoccus lijuaniae]|uniref:alpha/beta hydrolase n=1 Tax=Aerococcaceae bacterium zg-1292 TaxID=2774330 RepID=UPI001BD80955|nr:alpha/beta hydrolase [Aerococcaceae bacterium zg-A91]MBS4457521.1 alpha/beta hydrolase [Aerococcaceae bacterium zg-BR33]
MLVKDIIFDAQRPSVKLTTYVLDDSHEMLNGQKRPGVLICPGGGYLNCSDREAEPIALRFASMGYHAFVLRYSVFLDNPADIAKVFRGETFEVRSETVYPAPIYDIATAMTVLHEHADEWLLDTERIALCGFSAGGHNVLNYAVKYNKSVITDVFDATLVKPAAIIAGYPISDYVFMKEFTGKRDEMARSMFKMSNLALFGVEEPDEALLKELSPAYHVDAQTPPMFLWATAGDNLVPVGHTTRMATALADQQILFEVHIYEQGDHGLALATQATASAKTEVNPIVAEWIVSADKWLKTRFALPLNDMPKWRSE